MDFGIIKGDMLRFLHQAFITDSINHALNVPGTDVRLYHIDDPDRNQLVKIVTDYIKKKLVPKGAKEFEERFSIHTQAREGWGRRIENVFGDCFSTGYTNVLVVGSRTPTFTSSGMKMALKMLKESDAVFGPTPEGRYYTIGMTGKAHIDLSAFDWKAPTIYSQVSDALSEKGCSWSELEIWYCVEHSDDLEMMVRDINQYRFEGDEVTCRETEVVMERILAKLEP